jgi:hypothetical protein
MSLWWYLLVPRLDGWFKWTICPGVFLVVAEYRGGLGAWPRMLVLWLVLDWLIYAARYQWNDIRGYANDLAHVHAARRTRLPAAAGGGAGHRHVVLSRGVLALRLALALAAAALVGDLTMGAVLLAGVFGTAGVYEWMRSRGAVTAVWLLIGTGYGIRAVTGAYAAGVPLASAASLAIFAYFAAVGAMFCLLSWALDATSHDGAPAPVRARYLASKPHVAHLLHYTAPDPGGGRVLLGRGRVIAPWNVAVLVAAGTGPAVGVAIAGPVPMAVLALVTLVSLLGAGVLVAAQGSVARGMVTVVVGVALAAAGVLLDTGTVVAVILPWGLLAISYTGLRASSYTAIKRPPRQWLTRLSSAHRPTAELSRGHLPLG